MPPTVDEFEAVLRRLALEPWDLTRLGEPVAAELGLAAWPREAADRTRWIETLAAHPTLMFLSTLANQAASPGTVLNPFELYPVMGAGLDTLVVDKDMNPYLLGKMFFAMEDVNSGEGKSMNMPVSGSVGGNLQWDRPKVKQLVDQLKNDDPVTVTSER